MKKAIIFLLAIASAYFIVYFAVKHAVNDGIKEVVSATIREEFLLQELKGNVFTNF